MSDDETRILIEPDPEEPASGAVPPPPPPGPPPAPPSGPPLGGPSQPMPPLRPGVPVGIPAPQTSGKSTLAMIFGILSVVVPVCLSVLGIPAIVLGVMALKEIARNPALGGRGQAKAGLILGIVGLVLFVVVGIALVALGVFVDNAADDWSDDYYDDLYDDDYGYDDDYYDYDYGYGY